VNSPEPPDVQPSSKVRAYLELVRLPNLFTAAADVVMGFFFTHEVLGRGDDWTLGALIAASVLLYAGGVALNDVFDLEVDRHERPERPLPSGRISVSVARALGWELLVVGVALGWAAGFLAGHPQPGIVATLLAGCVVFYDACLKRTPLGPVGMGGCRMLNVLLGMSAMPGPWEAHHWLVAAGIGTYIAGVTWFARSEVWLRSRVQLGLAILVMLAGVGLLAWFPAWTDPPYRYLQTTPSWWYMAMGLLGLFIARPAMRAVAEADPDRVQFAVKQCILSLVILDAVACFAMRGAPAAIVVVLFLIPAAVLGRWIYST